MNSRLTRVVNRVVALAVIGWSAFSVAESQAESRKFNVYLVNPRPSWTPDGTPPPGMQPNPTADIGKYYSDLTKNGVGSQERVDSFDEWWFEVSYGNVSYESQVMGWSVINWPVSPQNDNNLTPDDFVRLDNVGDLTYGRGEQFYDGSTMIYIDVNGDNPDAILDGQFADTPAFIEDGAYTPGERYIDLDTDQRYDALIEYYSLQDLEVGGDPDCISNHRDNDPDFLQHFDGDYTIADGSLPDGCNPPLTNYSGFGSWDECVEAVQNWLDEYADVNDGSETCTCDQLDTPVILVQGCDPQDFYDAEGDDTGPPKRPEPYEDFLVMRDRLGIITNMRQEYPISDLYYQLVSNDYIDANYPGDVEAVKGMRGNAQYDPPERWDPFGYGAGVFRPGADMENFDNSDATGNLVQARNYEEVGVATNDATTPMPSWVKDFWLARYGHEEIVIGDKADPTKLNDFWPPDDDIPGLENFDVEAAMDSRDNPTQLNFNLANADPLANIHYRGGNVGYGTAGEQDDMYNDLCCPYTLKYGTSDCDEPSDFHSDCQYGDGTYWEPGEGAGDVDGNLVHPSPGMNYIGPKEYDDLPSSVYHSEWTIADSVFVVCDIDPFSGQPIFQKACECAEVYPDLYGKCNEIIMRDYGGSTTFGEVTTSDPEPLEAESTVRRNYGHDRQNFIGTSNPDGFIPPAGPLGGMDFTAPLNDEDSIAYDETAGRPDYSGAGGVGPFGKPIEVHGGGLADGGNVLTLEYLTWVRTTDRTPSRPVYQLQNIVGQSAGSSGAGFDFKRTTVPRFSGFADFDLDGLLDVGEGVPFDINLDEEYLGVENYAYDGEGSTENDGVQTQYPYNRERMIEDTMEVFDPIYNFRDRVNAQGIDGIMLLPGGLTETFGDSGVDVAAFSTPAGSYTTIPVSDLWLSDFGGQFCVGNCDLVPTPLRMFEGQVGVNHMAIMLDRGHPGDVESAAEGKYKIAFAAHEYGHINEGWPDLYDYELLNPQTQGTIEAPIGGWDIMAGDGDVGLLPLVHTIPIHKQTSGWIKSIDLTSVLTPGVEGKVTIVGSEGRTPDQAYYFFQNQNIDDLGEPLTSVERFDFWYLSDTRENEGDQPKFGDQYPWGDVVVEGLALPNLGRVADECVSGDPPTGGTPDGGMIMMISEYDADSFGEPPQQIVPTRPTNLILQADGKHDMEEELLTEGGNAGDNGDLWPGNCEATTWDLTTDPTTKWRLYGSSGLSILDVENLGLNSAGFGSARVSFLWIPQDTATLSFTDIEATVSIGSLFPMKYRAYDLFGGTTISVYHDDAGTSDYDGQLVSSFQKLPVLGTGERTGTLDVNVGALDDGEYQFYAFLSPGAGSGGTEHEVSPARAAQTNVGEGYIGGPDNTCDPDFYPQGTCPAVILTGTPPNASSNASAMAESWTVECVDDSTPGAEKWTVTGSESGLQTVDPNDSESDPVYWVTQRPTSPTYTKTTNPADAIEFAVINPGAPEFAVGDTFTFTTPGWTVYSEQFIVEDGEVNVGIQAVINATNTVGSVPLTSSFDGSASQNPGGDLEDVTFEWDFGDGSPMANGMNVDHTYLEAGTYDVSLTVTNLKQQTHTKIEESLVVAQSNPPILTIDAEPNSGPLPLVVNITASATDPDDDEIEKYEGYKEVPCVSEDEFDIDGLIPDTTTNTNETEIVIPYIYTEIFNGCAVVKVTDSSGESTTKAARIDAGNLPPLAVLDVYEEGRLITGDNHSGDVIGFIPLTLDFDGSNSTDADLDPLTYELKIDDDIVSTNSTYTHVFDEVGYFTVTLTVRDDNSAESSSSINVDTRLGQGNVITADITAVPNEGPSPLLVNFTAISSDTAGEVLTHRWDPGDGSNFVFGKNVSHTYINSGDSDVTYTVTLLVYDDLGAQTSVTETITVQPAGSGGSGPDNDPNLVAVFEAVSATSGASPLTVEFSTEGSMAQDGTPVTCRIDFGDGNTEVLLPGVEVQHTYVVPGTYLASSTTVGQTSGETQSGTVQIDVFDSEPPVASLVAAPLSGSAPLTVTFDASGSTDPENTALTYLWDFGDGSPSQSGAVVQHVYNNEGTYTVSVTVTDASSAFATAEVTVSVDAGSGIGSGGGTTLPDTNPTQDEPTDAADNLCGSGCGPMGAGQLMIMLIGLLGLKGRRRQ